MSSVASSDCGNVLILQEKYEKLKLMFVRERKFLEECRSENATIASQLVEYTDKLTKIEAELRPLKDYYCQMQTFWSNLSNQLGSENNLSSKLERLSVQLDKVTQLETLNSELMTRLSEFESQHNSSSIENENALNEANSELSNLKHVNEELKNRVKELLEIKSLREEALAEKNEEVGQLESRLKLVKTDYDNLVKDKENEIVTLKESLDRANFDLDMANSSKVESVKFIETLSQQILQRSVQSSLLSEEPNLSKLHGSILELMSEFAQFRDTSDSSRSTLDLEVNEYAKSVANLKDALVKKDEEVKQIQLKLDDLKVVNDKAVKMKQLLLRLRKELAEKERSEAEAKDQIDQLQGDLAAHQSIFGVEKQTALTDRITSQEQELAANSRKLQEVTRSRDGLDSQLQQVLKEFQQYKVKAEAVLGERKENDEYAELELEQQIANLQEENVLLKEQIATHESTMEASTCNLSLAQTQRQMLQQKLDQLQANYSTLLEQEREQKENLQELKRLMNKPSEPDPALVKLLEDRVRHETEARCRRECQEQVQLLEAEMQTLVRDYRAQLNQVKQRLARVELDHADFIAHDNKAREESPVKLMNQQTEVAQMEMPRRLEADGSDNNDQLVSPNLFKLNALTTGCSSQRQLLATKITPLTELIQPGTVNNHGEERLCTLARLSADELFDHLAREIRKNEHLTSLLADNETMVNHLTEQSTVLKSEIRRLERNLERLTVLGELGQMDLTPVEMASNEKEIHSKQTRSEYLKNVLIKFIALPRSQAEERKMLAQVISSMLSLDPQERLVLEAFAQLGQSANEAVTSHAASSYHSLISSYLPSLPSWRGGDRE